MSQLKKRSILLSCLLLVLAGGLVADTWFNNYEKGRKAIKKKKWADAVSYMQKALDQEKEPKLNAKTVGMNFIDYLPYYHLGQAQYNLGQYKEAISSFERSKNFDNSRRKRIFSGKLRELIQNCRAKMNPQPVQTQVTQTKPQPLAQVKTKQPPTQQPATSKWQKQSPVAKPQGDTKKWESVEAKNKPTVTPKPKQEQTKPETKTQLPVKRTPQPIPSPGKSTPGAAQTLIADGKALYSAGNFQDAQHKFAAVMQVDEGNPTAAKWLNIVEHSLDITILNSGIRFYFNGNRSQCKEALEKAIKAMENQNETGYTESLVTAYQFMAVLLIENHYLDDDTSQEILKEAYKMIAKIKALKPGFQLENDYFSPKVAKIFSSN
ncbi:MAG: hypothetical protein GY940_37005 [bacterium]|nr:hypothetical protein [bacterium]